MIDNKLIRERKEVLEKRAWFVRSDRYIQERVLGLPAEFDGFVADLANRDDEIGSVEVVRLIGLAVGRYMVIPVFEVRSELTNEVFSYEYVSWRHGKHPGFKGSLFVEVDGKIEYFVVKKSEKFATGGSSYDSIGGFVEFADNRLKNLPRSIERELKRQLGVSDLRIKRFVKLGYIHPDIGMSNNKTDLFAAMIDGKQIGTGDIGLIKPNNRLSFEITVRPISELMDFVDESDDAYFLAVVARMIARGLISL
jgi:hypothetical protein